MSKKRLRKMSTWMKVGMLVLGVCISRTGLSETEMVKDIRPGSESGNPWFLIDFKDALYFTAEDGMAAMWSSDGTTEGTAVFKEFAPFGGSDPGAFVVAGDMLFFRGTDNQHGTELWVSDGTPEGTVLTKDIWPGGGRGFLGWPIPWKGGVLFAADDGVSGLQFWTSDGTEAGTQRFEDAAISWEANPRNFFPFGDTWLFKSEDPTHGAELWRTDGTEGGSELVKDIVPGPTDSFLFGYPEFATLNDSVVFWVRNENSRELWRTDGTEAGTHRFWVLSDPNVEPYWMLTPYQDMVLFFMENSYQDWALWRTDGTEAGTEQLKGGFISEPGYRPVEYNGFLYLSLMTNDRVSGNELWRTDGTKAGTQLFVDINPGPGSSSPGDLTRYAGRLYFEATDGILGEELYRTDGTAEGTELVADIATGSDSSSPDDFTVSQGALFFAAREPNSGKELYKTTAAVGPVSLSGRVESSSGAPLCAMVLASGKFDFCCNPDGPFSLANLSRESNGTVKRQVYADGFFPKVDVLQGSASEIVVMQRSGTCPSYNTPYIPGVFPGSAGKRVDIRGSILLGSSGTPLCAMVLANGVHVFSCDSSGNYNMNIPLDANGQFKLQVYADGFAPYTSRFDESRLVNDVLMARASECK